MWIFLFSIDPLIINKKISQIQIIHGIADEIPLEVGGNLHLNTVVNEVTFTRVSQDFSFNVIIYFTFWNILHTSFDRMIVQSSHYYYFR